MYRDLRGKRWAVVSTVTAPHAESISTHPPCLGYDGHSRLGPNREIVLLKLREAVVREEDLKELPDVRGRLLRRPDRRRAVREADTNGLVDEEPSHVRCRLLATG